MGTNVIVVTVDANQYKIEKNGISDFALIGVLECILADLKTVARKCEVKPALEGIGHEGKTGSFKEEPLIEIKEELLSEKKVENAETGAVISEGSFEVDQPRDTKPVVPVAPASDLKSRIINARQAILSLKGEVEDLDLGKLTEEELQTEFDELTAQYKRLKSSQTPKKR